MSKRNERREADRFARKLAYQQSRQESSATAAAAAPAHDNTEALQDLLATCEQDNLDHLEPEIRAVLARTNPNVLASMEQSQTMAASLRASLPTPPPPPEPQPEPAEPAKRPATPAQTTANRENAQKSTGPTTPEGKAAVSHNRRSHGLAGNFHLLPWEDEMALALLAQSFYSEHEPATPTEHRLVQAMIQHHWLKLRAIALQEDVLFNCPNPLEADGKKLALFLRYQTTHERSYYKAEKELQNLKKTKQKEQIGFESQKQKAEAHAAKIRLANARAAALETETAARQAMEAPLPGHVRLTFEELTKACSSAIASAVYARQQDADSNT